MSLQKACSTNHKPVALLKINKLGVLGGKTRKVSGVANMRTALLS